MRSPSQVHRPRKLATLAQVGGYDCPLSLAISPMSALAILLRSSFIGTFVVEIARNHCRRYVSLLRNRCQMMCTLEIGRIILPGRVRSCPKSHTVPVPLKLEAPLFSFSCCAGIGRHASVLPRVRSLAFHVFYECSYFETVGISLILSRVRRR